MCIATPSTKKLILEALVDDNVGLPALEDTNHSVHYEVDGEDGKTVLKVAQENHFSNTLVWLLWDCIVPNITWIGLVLLYFAPPHLRVLPALLWILPHCWKLIVGDFPGDCFRNYVLPHISKTKNCQILDSSARSKATSKLMAESLKEKEAPCFVGLHPHGRYPMDILPWMGFQKKSVFHKTVLAQSSLGKFIPSVGLTTMLMNNHVIDVTRSEIQKAHDSGKTVALFPGGAREMTLCEPFDNCIPLVRRDGFLRIAYNNRAPAVPTFLFGMHDAFYNPLSWLDKTFYHYTKVNLPLWFPCNPRTKELKRMVLGNPINPLDYDTEDAFISAYYKELEDVFEKNKLSIPGYGARTLCWVQGGDHNRNNETTKTKQKAKHRNASTSFLAEAMGLVFILATIVYKLGYGVYWKIATAETFPVSALNALQVHLAFAALWMSLSVALHNGAEQKSRKIHKALGYCAATVHTIMIISGYYLAIQSLQNNTKPMAQGLESTTRATLGTGVNAVVQTLGTLQTGGASSALLSSAILSASRHQYSRHVALMRGMNAFFVLSLLPRIISVSLRYLVGYFLDNDTIYSMSCMALVAILTWKICTVRNPSTKKFLVRIHSMVLVTSIGILALEYLIGFPLLVGAVLGPMLCLVGGVLLSP